MNHNFFTQSSVDGHFSWRHLLRLWNHSLKRFIKNILSLHFQSMVNINFLLFVPCLMSPEFYTSCKPSWLPLPQIIQSYTDQEHWTALGWGHTWCHPWGGKKSQSFQGVNRQGHCSLVKGQDQKMKYKSSGLLYESPFCCISINSFKGLRFRKPGAFSQLPSSSLWFNMIVEE